MIPAASVLDRERTALVVVDVQERLAAAMSRRAQVVARTNLLLRVARIVGMPVIVTLQYPRGLGGLEPPVASVLEEIEAEGVPVTRVEKLAFDCFSDEAFCDAVTAAGRKQLLMLGMESHICVSQSALAGLREGFDVHVAGDACCSREDEHHGLAVARLGHAGGVITTSESAAYELVGCAGTEEFRELLAVVKG